jgi:hypothetical protein
MKPTIAVCLMTCDRDGYTRRTIDSFLEQNPDRSRFVLLHGDDASKDQKNHRLARAAGFRTVVQHQVRCGILATRIAMIQAAANFAPWVLVLENDQESIRPFPWELFDFVARNKKIYCLRLFGEFKDAARRDRCKVTHQWKRHRLVKWYPLEGAPEKSQFGAIHWSAQPTVTRVISAIAIHCKHKRDVGLTARVLNNVMVHIGEERTAAEPVAC